MAAKFQQAAPAALLLEAGAVAVGAGLFEATKVAASFEQAMADVRAVMTPSEAQQFGGALGDLAVQLGQQTVFSAREAAAGIGELIRAGIPAESVLGGAAAAALNLAAATGISVASAATTAAQTMNAFHKTAADLTGVVDTLAGTANATAATMSDLQFGLQVVSATANTMGLSFQDTTAAIGIFVNAGITGATAGTGLRQMLLELIPTTKPAREEMLKLGITTRDGGNAFFDAAGHVRNLAGISQVLQNALKGMSDQQRIAALNTLFTRDAINSATILAQQGAAGVNALTAEIAKISAADTAAIRLGTLQGAINNLGSSVETVQIIVGNIFLPTIRGIAETVRGAVDSFSGLDPALQKAVVVFVSLAGAAAGVIGGMVLLAPFVSALPGAFAALGAILPRVLAFFGPLGAAAALLVAAWRTNLSGIQGIVSDAFARLPDALDFLSAKFDEAGVAWETSIVPPITRIGLAIGERLGSAFATIAAGPLGNLGLVFQKVFVGDIGGAVDTFIAIVGAIVPRLGPIIQGIRSTISDIIVQVSPILANLGLVFQKLFAGDIGGSMDTLRAIIGAFAPELGKLITPAVGVANAVGPQLGTAFSFLGTAMDQIMSGHGDVLVDFLKSQLPEALQVAGTKLEGLGPTFTAVGGFFTGLGAVILSLNGEKLKTFGDTFGGAFTESFSKFGNQLQPLIPTFVAIGGFVASLNNLITTIETLKSRGAAGTDTGDAIVSPLQRLVDFVKANGGLGDISDFLGPLGQSFKLFRDNAAGIAEFFDGLAAALDNFSRAIKEMPEPPAWLLPFMEKGVAGGAAATGGAAGNAVNVAPPNAFDDAVTNFFGGNNVFDNLFKQTALNLTAAGGGAGGGGGNVIIQGDVNIAKEVDADNFLSRMATLVRGSAGRVNAPPDNSGVPALSTGVI